MLQKLTAAVFEEQDRNKVLSEIHMRSFVEKLYREMGPENPIAAFVSMSTRYLVLFEQIWRADREEGDPAARAHSRHQNQGDRGRQDPNRFGTVSIRNDAEGGCGGKRQIGRRPTAHQSDLKETQRGEGTWVKDVGPERKSEEADWEGSSNCAVNSEQFENPERNHLGRLQ